MGKPLRALIVEDVEQDALLVVRELKRGGFDVAFERVETPESMSAALAKQAWDIVISDYSMPRFSAPLALRVMKERQLELPFIVVSGTVGEETAVEVIHAGACDFMVKGKLARLIPAIERELLAAEARREQKRTEDDLYASHERSREREQQLSSIYDTVADVIFQLAVEEGGGYRFTSVNPAFHRVTGLSPDQVIGKRVAEIVPEPALTLVLGEYNRAIREGRIVRWEETSDYPTGRLTGEVSVAPICDDTGKCTHLVGAVHDITERKRTDEALRRSEARHTALLEGLPDPIFLLDHKGVFLDYHASDPSLLFLPPERFLGRSLADTLPPEVVQRLDLALTEVLGTGKTRSVDFTLTISSGLRHFEARIAPMEGSTVTVVTRDVTTKRVMEDQLRQAQKMEAVGQLTGGIAHDFNNALTVIIGNAELIANELPAGAVMRKDVAEILTAGRRGATMVGRLLQFSRRGMLTMRRVELDGVIADLGGMLHRLLPETIRIEIVPGGDLGEVHADAGALEQILLNLCTNARDAMPDGGTLQIAWERTWLDEGYHATHPWVSPGAYACITVSDTGTGMDQETMRKIFEPFFTTKPPDKGTGLGMAMVYGLMKQHNGMVHVYSEMGKGTVVKLYLPVATETAETGAAPRFGDPDVTPGGTETILLAEDDVAIQRATRRALESRGYVVLAAGDGEEALEVYRNHEKEIALVISDLVMPKLGGRQLAEALRRQGSTARILFTSGYSPGSAYREGAFLSGTVFLHKPWSLTDLFRKVRELLDQPLGG